MKRLVIHIGSSKTGTSSLQHLFVNNYDALLEQKVLYPNSCRQHPDSTKLRHYAIKHVARTLVGSGETDSNGNVLRPSFVDKRQAQKFLDELDSEMESTTQAELVFISDEALTERMTPEEVKFLSDWARPRFQDVRVVFCAREPFSYLTSKFSQALKEDRGRKWEKFIAKFLSDGIYEWKIRQWKDNFDADEFIILPKPRDSIDYFCLILNVDRSLLEDSGQRRNISLDPLAAMVMFEVNKQCAELDPKTISAKAREKIRRACLRACIELVDENLKSGPSLVNFEDIEYVYSRLENDIRFLKEAIEPSSQYSRELREEWTPEFVAQKIKLEEKPFLSREAYSVEAKAIASELVQLKSLEIKNKRLKKNQSPPCELDQSTVLAKKNTKTHKAASPVSERDEGSILRKIVQKILGTRG